MSLTISDCMMENLHVSYHIYDLREGRVTVDSKIDWKARIEFKGHTFHYSVDADFLSDISEEVVATRIQEYEVKEFALEQIKTCLL